MIMSKASIATCVSLAASVMVLAPHVSAASGGEDVSMVVAKRLTIESVVLGETREVLVNLPPGYEEEGSRFPVLIALDGSAATAYLARASLSDRAIPGFVVVAVPNVDRIRDLSHRNIGDIWPTSGGSGAFLSFLTDELVPWVNATFRTTGYRVITGGSAAGNFAVFALLKTPALFDAAIALSPALGTDYELIRNLATTCFRGDAVSDHFLAMVYGSHDYPVVTVYAERFLRLLQDEAPPWLRFDRQVLHDKGHYQFAGLNAGMTALFHDFGFPAERFLAQGPIALTEHASLLATRFKMPVPPSAITDERAIQDAACDLARQHRFADATRVLDYGLELHPESPRLLYYRAQMLEHSGATREAITEYRRLLSMDASSGIAGMAKIFLDDLTAAQKAPAE